MENTSEQIVLKQPDSSSIGSSRLSATSLEEFLNKLPGASVRKANILYNLGKLYQQKEQYTTAEDYSDQAITMYNELREQLTEPKEEDLNHFYIQALNQLGVIYLAQNKLDYANSNFEQALDELNPNENSSELALTLYHFGLLHQAQEDDVQALEKFLKAQNVLAAFGEKDEVFGPVHYQIGRIFWTQKNYQEASIALTLALPTDTKDRNSREVANIYYYLGLIEQAQTNYVKALEYLESALEIYTKHAEGPIDADCARALFHLGTVYAAQGQVAFAESAFDQSKEACGLEPQNAEAGEILHQIGVFHQTQHHYELAIEEIGQALTTYHRARDDDNKYAAQTGMLLTLLGQLYLTQSNLALAQSDLDLAKTKLDFAKSNFEQALKALKEIYNSEHDDMMAVQRHIEAVQVADNALSSAMVKREEKKPNSLIQTVSESTPISLPNNSAALQVHKGSTTEKTGNNHLSNGSNAHSATSHPSSPRSETDEDSTWTYLLSCCGVFKTKQSTSSTATPTHGVTDNPLIEPLNNEVKGMRMDGRTKELV